MRSLLGYVLGFLLIGGGIVTVNLEVFPQASVDDFRSDYPPVTGQLAKGVGYLFVGFGMLALYRAAREAEDRGP